MRFPSLAEATEAEILAFDAILNRLNEGVKASDSKVEVLRLVQAHANAVRRAALIDARDRVNELIR